MGGIFIPPFFACPNRLLKWKAFLCSSCCHRYSSQNLCCEKFFCYFCQNLTKNLATMLFTERLKHLRQEQFLTQNQVAEALGIDTPMYSRIENGLRSLKESLLKPLAELYSMEYGILYKEWKADKLYRYIKSDKDADDIINIVAESISKYGSNN